MIVIWLSAVWFTHTQGWN